MQWDVSFRVRAVPLLRPSSPLLLTAHGRAAAALLHHEEEAALEDNRATGQKEPRFLMTLEPPKLSRRLYMKEKETSPLLKSLYLGVPVETNPEPGCGLVPPQALRAPVHLCTSSQTLIPILLGHLL